LQVLHSRSRRPGFVAAIASAAVIAATVAVQPAWAVVPTLNTPDRVYPVVNTVMAFTGTDPISNDNRTISVSGMAEGAGGCDTSAPSYDTTDCPRIQMSLDSGAAGLLRIPGNTAVDGPDVNPDLDTVVAASGAVITEHTDPNGGDSILFNFSGTEAQLNSTLGALQFVPTQDYEERASGDSALPNITIQAIQGDASADSVTRDIYVKVESENLAPTLTASAAPLDAPAGEETTFDNAADVTDPEMCNFTVCGSPFTNPGLKESDDQMLLVAWLAENDCGTFHPVGGAFTSLGGATNSSVHALLTNVGGLNLEDDQAAAIESSITPAALLLDLSTQPGSVGSPTTVFAGVGDLAEVKYALNHLSYIAPPTDAVCHLDFTVSDLGNNGTPASFVGSAVGNGGDTPEPGYEVPDAEGDAQSITFDVHDAHPDVTVEQTIPGPIPGVDPTADDAQFTITFNETIEGFDATDLDLSASTAPGATGVLTPITPGLIYSFSANAAGDGTIVVKIPAGAAFAIGHDGDAAYGSSASTSSDNEITIDRTPPTVTINQKAGQADPASTAPIVFTVVFSEANSSTPADFTADDVDLTASTTGGTPVASVSQPNVGDPTTYEVSVSGMTDAGDVIATVDAGAILDRALNPSEASTSDDNTVAWTTVPASGDFSINDVSVNEGAGTATFTVSRSSGAGTASVDVATFAGSATKGRDFWRAPATLTFADAQTTRSFVVNIVDDARDEFPESYTVQLSNPVGGALADATGVGTIFDNDPPPTVSVSDVVRAEGDSGTRTMSFKLELSAASGKQVKVTFETSNGSAVAPSDYTAKTVTVTFAPGQTVRWIPVVINGDTVVEPNQTFFVTLHNPVNATIGDGSASGQITTDD
jgi:hypothetical protein